jgi:MFS family permease
MVASMFAFAGSATGSAIVLVVLGLTLSGIGAGLLGPPSNAMVAGAVDPEDIGVANGMSQQVLFIGIVAGIQTMLVVVGDNATTSQYGWTFLFGAAVATLGLLAAMSARATSRARTRVDDDVADDVAVEPAYDPA